MSKRKGFFRVCRECGKQVWTTDDSDGRFACDDCIADKREGS